MNETQRGVGRGPRATNPLMSVLDLFSSVWFGIVLATLLFVFCSIGSAMPAVRQLPGLEMTEFEWFHWWPFNALVVLLTVSLTTVTVRRIPFRAVNLGVWTIHTGIIVMVLGSYHYFTTKVEGDAPVFRRLVRIELPGMTAPESLVALPGGRTQVIAGPDLWRFQIQDTNSAWPLLSEGDEGKSAYAVNVMVTPPGGEPFIRQLLAGYPQYTEDVLPGKGRAIKAVGTKLLRDDLKLTLDYEPQTHFHVMDTWALYVRRAGDEEWIERPIRGLPRYNEYIPSRAEVFSEPDKPFPLRSLDVNVAPAPGGDALSGATAHITGYLPYADWQQRWRDGGDRLYPVIDVSFTTNKREADPFQMVAFDAQHSQAADGNLQFVWLDRAERVAELPTDSRAVLRIGVPEKNINLELPLTPQNVVGAAGSFTPIEGTDFSYRVVNVQDNLVLPQSSGTVSVALVDIKTPEGQFTRMVANPAEKTIDMSSDSRDPHGGGASAPTAPDPRIQMTYQPASAAIILAAHPGGLHLVFNGMNGRVMDRPVRVGDTVELTSTIGLRIDRFIASGTLEAKPYVVPIASRQARVGQSFAMIRLEVATPRGVQSEWLRFNQYVFPDNSYSYGGRFAYTPVRFEAADGRQVEVILSRERMPLPNPIALDEFALDTHIGGYSGSATTIRNYVSRLRFLENGVWTEPAEIAVNAPTESGGFWYFQSTWDKPPTATSTAGMNFTGLGVGNRNGVYTQLVGCCLSVAGMIYAFYVKPVLKRRRAEQQRAKAGRHQWAESDEAEYPPRHDDLDVRNPAEPADVRA